MNRSTCWVLGVGVVLMTLSAVADAASEAVVPVRHRPLLARHCGTCHGAEKQEARLRFDTLSFRIDSLQAAETWQKVLNVMNAGEMPPEDAPQPMAAAKADFLDDLAKAIVVARKVLSDQHGAITMRRLNRREYANTIRSLLAIDVDVRSLPADASDMSFDTVGSSLFMSSDQFEVYRELGGKAVAAAFAQATTTTPVRIHRVQPEVAENKTRLAEIERQVSIQKRLRLWKQKVDVAAARPENQTAMAEIRTRRKDDPRGLYLDWEKLDGAPSPETFGFPDADDAFHHDSQWQMIPALTDYVTRPATKEGVLLGIQGLIVSQVPGDWPTGDYTVRIRVARAIPQTLVPSRGDTKPFALEPPDPSRCFLDVLTHTLLATHQVVGTMENPDEFTWTMRVDTSGARHFYVRERGDENQRWAILARRSTQGLGFGIDPALWVDWIEVEGPIQSQETVGRFAQLRSLLDQFDKKEIDARGFVAAFVADALRGREPSPVFLDRLAARHERLLQGGMQPRPALIDCLSMVLASPSFLYLAEPAAESGRRVLADVELASRLSYFLWSGPPDAELLSVAKAGDLRKRDVLGRQVDRMLADERSRTFVAAFVSQWLKMSRLDFFQFNPNLYPDFNAGVKEAARQEVYETFAHLLKHDGSLSQLLKSDTVVINGLLADYYGIEGVSGDEFRPVKVAAASPRGGLLGMAAILAMGSNGEHTSPVERGAWILRKLLHDPPPPAPPNVPQLTRLDGQLLTTRERMRAHQEEPQCASCHRKIDPLGFALENFDAVGRWRTEDSYEKQGVGKKTWPIDPAGAFHNGPSFTDFFEFRAIVAARQEDFATGFTEALIEYALGRPCGFSDDELVQGIVQRAATKGFSIREFIHAVAQSEAFRSK
jgi:cytochrome c553